MIIDWNVKEAYWSPGEKSFIHADVGGQVPGGPPCILEQSMIWFLKNKTKQKKPTRVSFLHHAAGEFVLVLANLCDN